MNFNRVGVVYRKELLDTLRDRRTIISTIVVGRNCRATFRTSSDESRRVSCWRFSHRHKPAAAQSLALLPIRPEVLSLVQRWNCVPPRQWLATAGHYQWRWYLSLRGG